MAGRPESYGRPKILFSVSSIRLRNCLSMTLNQAAFGNEPVLITRRGIPTAAIVSIDDLNLLENMKSRRDKARSRRLPDDQALIEPAIAQRIKEELFFEHFDPEP